MIDLDALKEAGLTNKLLKRVMTAEPPKQRQRTSRSRMDEKRADDTSAPTSQNSLERLPENPTDWDIRCHLETIIAGEIEEGMERCKKDFDKWSAVDLAYSSIPIHSTTLPLMQVAMGYISLDQCRDNIGRLSTEWRDKFFDVDRAGKPTSVRIPKLMEVSHNLVHSLVTRRVAALATETYQQFPLLKFEPYSNTQVGRLTGDVMTQLTEQMSGAYGYRKDYEESLRHATLYTDCIKFKKSAWHVDKQRLPVDTRKNGAAKSGKPEKKVFEDRIIREGVLFDIPHPTRRYVDISRPLSKSNQDLGPRWGGHWEAVPLGDVRRDKSFFNTDKIVQDTDVYSLMSQNPGYFSQYYDRISVPDEKALSRVSASFLALENDRNAAIGATSSLTDETSTILHQHYKRIVPKDYGLGTYPFPVWLRFVMVGMRTCVYSEIVGSAPWSVNSYNGSDQLLNSPSFGSLAIQWQQMLTNQMTELLHVQAQGLVRIFALNTHGMKKDEIEAVEKAIKNPDFSQLKDILIKYDAEKLSQRGQDIRTITEKISQIRIETSQKVTEIFNGMMNTLALCERLMFFSPQELGQVSARTTSATEQKAIRDTTLGIRDYHMMGIKQQMEADKRIIHSSLMVFGSEDLEVPIAERYEPAVIEKAGFTIVDDGTGNPPDGLYTVRGKKLSLFYNYTYTTRQTDDTPPDAALAQGLAQVYDIVNKDPVLTANLPLEQRVELANSLFQAISPGVSKLRVPPGTDGKKTQGGQVEQLQQELQQILPGIGEELKKLAAQQQQQAQTQQMTDAAVKALTQSITKLSASMEQAARAKTPRERPTPKGSVSPTTMTGVGAPPLRNVAQPISVPLIGPRQ